IPEPDLSGPASQRPGHQGLIGPFITEEEFFDEVFRQRRNLFDRAAYRAARGCLKFDYVKTDIRAKKFGNGEDYKAINPKGYVPALLTDDGELLTENPILQTWIADRVP